MKLMKCCVGLAVAMSVLLFALPAEAQQDTDARIDQLERMVRQLSDEISALRAEQSSQKTDFTEQIDVVSERVDEANDTFLSELGTSIGKLQLGGYADFHANFDQGSGKDKYDLHRFVIFAGYEFADWIQFRSETEIEHAFVDDGNGYINIEQAHVDFLLHDKVNLRIGRVLTPLGIVNKKHEPPSFNGVERPSFSKYIVPSTWSSDGIGVFGSIVPSLKYEAYVVGGLDGSKFNATNGIRSGRLKERPSLHDPAFTAKLDYYPFVDFSVPHEQALRVGVSGYFGGLDNGNSGGNPNIDAEISMWSADFEYSVLMLDFRGAVAHTSIDGAEEIGNGTADEMFGWYLESAVHVLPPSMRRGKLEKSDVVLFVRYDDYDTQYKMPDGVLANPKGDRDDLTLGVNFYLTPNFVLKADYQIRDDDTEEGLDDLLNFGIGMQF